MFELLLSSETWASRLNEYELTTLKITFQSSRQPWSNDDCLEDNREDYQNCSVLNFVRQLCTVIRAHVRAVLKVDCWFSFRLSLDLGLLRCVFAILFRCCLLLLFWFFGTKPRDWLERTSPKWPNLCQVGCKTSTQSISQLFDVPVSLLDRTWWVCVVVGFLCNLSLVHAPGAYPMGYKGIYTPKKLTHIVPQRDSTASTTSSQPGKYIIWAMPALPVVCCYYYILRES